MRNRQCSRECNGRGISGPRNAEFWYYRSAVDMFYHASLSPKCDEEYNRPRLTIHDILRSQSTTRYRTRSASLCVTIHIFGRILHQLAVHWKFSQPLTHPGRQYDTRSIFFHDPIRDVSPYIAYPFRDYHYKNFTQNNQTIGYKKQKNSEPQNCNAVLSVEIDAENVAKIRRIIREKVLFPSDDLFIII